MSENADMASNATTRRRKLQALLAGGAVLGVGAVVTLAAWTDDEFVLGQFGASTFNLEGSPTAADSGYLDHDEVGEAAMLTFDGDAMNMVPEQTVYSPFWVRLDESTDIGGTIQAQGGISVAASSGANAENLSFDVYHDVTACDAASVETGTLVASGDTLAAVDTNAGAVDLTANAAGTTGEAELLCFAVTAADESSFLQGEPASVTWQVQATSDEG